MSPQPPEGERAAAFRLPLLEGGVAGLPDLVEAGGGVLLFLKPGCPASELVAGSIGPLGPALASEGRRLLGVVQGDEPEARAFAMNARLPLAWEEAPYTTSRAYSVSVVPALVVVDGAGVVAERLEGFIKSEYLALGASLEQALALGAIPPVLSRPEDLPDAKPG
jgi:hypothetical protein